MKKTILLITIWLMSMAMQAQTISEQQARQTAAEFYQTREANKSFGAHKSYESRQAYGSYKPKESPIQATLRKAYEAPHQALYVFNNPEETGFVIVAGNERATSPILGWSDNGPFDYDNAPCGLKALLERYASGLKDSSSDGLGMSQQMDRKTPKRNTSENNEVAPLLTTIWNQTVPYNNQCPESSGGTPEYGGRCPTGCVQTAMAQLMNFYQWPKQGRGKHTNKDTRTKPEYEQTRDFSQSVYDWANMLATYKEGEYNDVQANAVATLMADIGCAMNAEYRFNETSALFDYNEENMATINAAKYFHYKELKAPQGVNGIQWSLQTGHPVLCSLFMKTGKSPYHLVVYDGYRMENNACYYHVNFGWGGKSDGYYISDRDKNPLYYYAEASTTIVPSDAITAEKDGVYCDIINGEATVMCATEKDPGHVVVIPEEVEAKGQSYSVTTINDFAFRGSSVRHLTIPGTIKCIPRRMCQDTSVSWLTLGEGVEEVGDSAFLSCKNLYSVDFPASIRRIGKYAFGLCDLGAFSMKGSGFVIDELAFSGNHKTLLSVKGLEGAARIGKSAVQGIMEGTFRVGAACQYDDYAVIGNFDRILIPASVTDFNLLGVTGTAAYEVETGNPNYSSGDGLLFDKQRTTLLRQPGESHNAYLPATVTTIAPNAYNKNLYYATLASSVKTLDGAFADCRELREITCLSPTPPVITDENTFSEQFKNNISSKLFVPYGSKAAYEQAEGWKIFRTIQEKFFSDGQFHYSGPYYSDSKQEYATVAVVGRDGTAPFDGQAHIPSSVNVNGTDCTVTSIELGAFNADNEMQTITLPSTLYSSTLYGSSFFGCDNLRAFYVDGENEKYHATNGVLFTTDSYDRNVLTAYPPALSASPVTIPAETDVIGTNSFDVSLQEVTIPASVTYVDRYAFYHCPNLHTIRCLSETPPSVFWASERVTFFPETYETATLYVPKGCVNAYKGAREWNSFWHIEEFDPADVTPVTIGKQTATRTYNLQGQRVGNGYRGIVISSGRKVFSK